MAHAKRIAMAIAIVMTAFIGCTKMEPNAKLADNYDSKPSIEKVSEGEKVLRWDYKDLRMQFFNGQLEDSFVPMTITNKEDKEGTRIADRIQVKARGVETQYFEPKTENFSEKEGATTTLAAKELNHDNGWVWSESGKVYEWDARNIDDVKDCPYSYRDTVWMASAVYTFEPDSLEGYQVKFPAIPGVVKAGEKKTQEVDGVAYNGKTWNALKVSYPSTVTYTIPSEYRVSGGKYEMKEDIVNIVYYLRHEVKTTLEGLTYQVNILDGEKIYKEYQTVDFRLVTRDNGEIKTNVPYRLEEEFDITAVKVEDVEVYSEDALKDTKVDLTKGEIKGSTEAEDIFKKTSYSGSDKASMTDGRSTDVKISYEGYAWNTENLPYASVTGRKAELKSVKNSKETTAAKVVYDVTLTLTYTVAYNNSNKKSEDKVIVIKYKRFMKVDNFETKLEDLGYKVNILDGESIYKEYQTVNFNIVLRNNGEVVESTPYELEEAFDITAVEVKDVEVDSEDALKDTKVDLTKGKIKGSTEAEDIFKKTSYSGSDKVSMTDGRSTDVKIVYEGYAWNTENLPYASVTDRKAELKSVKNSKETTVARMVYDVTLTLTYTVAYNNSDKKSEDKVIVITYKRFMKVDNYETTVEASKYELSFEQPNESEMGTAIQRNTYHEVTTNNGEVVKDTTYYRDIAMSAKLTRTGAARKAVDKVNNLTVSILPKGGDKTTYGSKDANGIQTMTVSRKYDVLTSDGATYELVISDEKDIREGEDFGHHASFADAAFEPKVSLQPTLNPSESTATSQVYDVKVSVDMPVNRTDRAATKAAGDETFTVTASHQETLEVPDEYDPSKDREEWIVTPNGNGFDITGRKFETRTLSGETKVDEKSGRLNVSLTGVNGSVKTVKNVSDYQTNGNGWNGTGNGTYKDNASNGVAADSFENEYKRSADGSLTITLKGRDGKDVSKTFDPTFVISEGGQSISNGTEKESYVSYTYSNKVNGVYSVEGKEVKLSATASRELRIEKEIDELVGNLIGAGMSVVPAHWTGNGFVDGSGKQRSTVCLTLVKADGSAAPIVFSYENQTEQDKKDNIPFMIVPTDDMIRSANFTDGSYDSTYDSGVYISGKWVPAVAKDNSWGISYSIPSQKDIRSIRNESLKQWDWRGGNYSTQLSTYSVKVENGVCSIYYNGELVKQFR